MAISNGSVIPSIASGEDFYTVRNAPKVIRLARRQSANPLNPTGSYCCSIPTIGGNMTFCINLSKCLSHLPIANSMHVPYLTIHSCTAVVCPFLALPNGNISYTDPTLGVESVASHSCRPGFALPGSASTRECRDNGSWSGSNLFCEVACLDLPAENVTYDRGSAGARPVNTVVTYSCDGTKRTCQSDCKWSGSAPICAGK